MASDIQATRNALMAAMPRLHARANVVATGIGYKVAEGQQTSDLAIVCSVTRKLAVSELSATDVVPLMLDGIATDVVETGTMFTDQGDTRRLYTC